MNTIEQKLEALAMKEMCGRCEARPDERCRTVNGHPTGMHNARMDPIRLAYALGQEIAATTVLTEVG